MSAFEAPPARDRARPYATLTSRVPRRCQVEVMRMLTLLLVAGCPHVDEPAAEANERVMAASAAEPPTVEESARPEEPSVDTPPRERMEPRAGYAILSVAQTIEECSGAGGRHVVFEVHERLGTRGVSYAHFGGHAYYPISPGIGLERAFPLGALYVGEVVPFVRADEDHDGNPDSSAAGWCLDGLMKTDGVAGGLRRVGSAEEARRLAAELTAQLSPDWDPTAGRPPSCLGGSANCLWQWSQRVR